MTLKDIVVINGSDIMNCKDCEYYNEYEENCGAFECNGLDCPTLPCEKESEEDER